VEGVAPFGRRGLSDEENVTGPADIDAPDCVELDILGSQRL
jgi:hypothetical protein